MNRFAPALVAAAFGIVLTLRVGLAGAPSPAPIAPLSPMPAHGSGLDPAVIQAQNETIQRTAAAATTTPRAKASCRSPHSTSRSRRAAEIAEKMVRKLRAGMMPPKDCAAARCRRRAWRWSPRSRRRSTRPRRRKPNPGRRSFQRLNRAEYAAAIRALFGLDIDVSAYLPADTISAGFDNIADVQMPSATVMQGYMRAAAYVSRVAVGDPSADPSSTTYDVPRTRSQKERVEGAPFGTRGGTVVTHNFPADGKYKFQLLLHGEPTGALFGRTMRAIQMEVAIDGARAAL